MIRAHMSAWSTVLLSAVLLGGPNALVHGQSSSVQLIVNVPAARLDVWQEGNWTRSFRITVGSPRFPTPLGDFALDEIIWNPWWVPPPSDWARAEKAQPPSPRNPMGRVKLNFTHLYFLHGTADQSGLGRAVSHGCIRLHNDDALELARIVVAGANVPMSAALVDSLIADPTRTRRVPLVCTVPLTIRYDLAEVRDTVLVIYSDLYGRAPDLRTEMLAALARAGITVADLEMDQVERVVQQKPRPRSVPLRQLVRAEVWRRIQRATQSSATLAGERSKS